MLPSGFGKCQISLMCWKLGRRRPPTKAIQMDTEPDYSEQWRDLRRRRLIVALLAVCTMVFILVNLIGLPRIWVDGAFYIVFGGWIVGVFLASRRPMTFLCPRCHQPFFRTPL